MNAKVIIPKRIFIMWGGAISKEAKLYKEIATKSGNPNVNFKGPESWGGIRSVGNKNYFDDAIPYFFLMSQTYASSLSVINNFIAQKGQSSRTETHIVFDNCPDFKVPDSKIIAYLSKAFYEKDGRANGFHVKRNIISFAQKMSAYIIITDRPNLAISASEKNINSILLLRKWNRVFCKCNTKLILGETRSKNIENNLHLAEDWDEAKEIINNLMKEH